MTALRTLSVVLLAAPAMAFAQTSPAPAPSPDQAPPAAMPAPSADAAGVNASTAPVPADQLPWAQASALAAGDNQMVTNGPVPDTPANRAKYGGPNSRAGRRTAPTGN